MSNQYFGDDRIVHETPTDILKVSSRRIYSDSEVSDDIVTHLRAVAADFVYRADISVDKLNEAIDEIERLRAQVANLQASYDVATNWQYKFLAAYDGLTKVVRGD